MTALFLDPVVLLRAFGAPHPDREACVALLERAQDGEIEFHLSVEGGQEFLFHRLRMAARDDAVAEFDAVDALVTWHDFDAPTLRVSRRIVGEGHARGRDAVHAATALGAGFTEIVSLDRDFDQVPGLRRVHPADVATS
ncbi:hypothetical protein BJY21_002927 [Kineosphaera limosa]|uniref:Ribonuclease VapC n=1 Tax=Kineosphaera limosa NBRC 100340 TaxID=1184609 RepID=K6XCC7_9MICO|nr:type II toxin-antitoxin system VapC family toxin [Kineosphaera limosa]NYE01743.1 hypothetical protein [Kineosphaera limosa]GAB96459.1 hypothetical protein KILIM_039_00330 [Kineosphaera limosa NBRC 100340]